MVNLSKNHTDESLSHISLDKFRYHARTYKDIAVEKEMLTDLKVMAFAALGSLDFKISHSVSPSNFGIVGVDPIYHYFCYVDGRGYMFYNKTEIGLYCNIIEKIVGDKLYVPFN